MSMLKSVTKGKIKRPHFILVYGIDGVGKSSLAADAPSPVFLGTERGTDQLEVNRFPAVKRLFDITKAISELTNDPHDYKTLVIDTIDWLEPLVHANVAETKRVQSIEDIPYGKGPGYALEIWEQLRLALETLREKRNMNIILLGHAELENFTDVANDHQTYQRYGLKLQKKAAAKWREAVDAVLFAHYLVHKTTDKVDKKIRILDGKKRVLYTERRPGFDAKNRLGLPPMIGLGWADLMAAIERGQNETAPEIIARITRMLDEVTDEALKETIKIEVAKAADNLKMLKAYAERLDEIIETQDQEVAS